MLIADAVSLIIMQCLDGDCQHDHCHQDGPFNGRFGVKKCSLGVLLFALDTCSKKETWNRFCAMSAEKPWTDGVEH
ncbi:hypothetical protein PGTUg99_009827 [Puccinia graminis f. sp. tritici]|uniref:Uncharacterized protein n=1 Tax=Puccinia graminis f. sp. tritici TaxID=56615 RepID=A0A5B0RBU1_PUCGR|nr:hypothetical protein PGTUg99_009827 [Puccinia graminis f. sp. tritici]